jgi:hypothetical protein
VGAGLHIVFAAITASCGWRAPLGEQKTKIGAARTLSAAARMLQARQFPGRHNYLYSRIGFLRGLTIFIHASVS